MKYAILALVVASFSSVACDLDNAKYSADEAVNYSHKAKNAGTLEEASIYARKAENAANDVVSYLSDCEVQQMAQAAHVADPMREATLTAPGVRATVSNGFFNATINDKKAKVKRFNQNYYEITGGGYIVSISLDDEGIQSASYTKQHSKTNGIMQVKQ